MNTKKIFNFYILICLFPAWLLSSNIILNDKFLFFLPYIFLFIILTRYFNLKFESKFKLDGDAVNRLLQKVNMKFLEEDRCFLFTIGLKILQKWPDSFSDWCQMRAWELATDRWKAKNLKTS